MGYGLIEVNGTSLRLISMGVLKLPARLDTYERLQKIHEQVCTLVELHQPTACAIEAPFFGKNVQSMLKLGRAQGVAIAAAIQKGVSVIEYSPKKIKQSITGNGNASKQQVMKMLQHLVGFVQEPRYLDATDALAVALCHHFQQGGNPQPSGKKSGNDWAAFLAQHPGRIRKPHAGGR